MQENKSINEPQEQVVLYPNKQKITINHACEQRAYGLFDSQTGTQVSDFVKGTQEPIIFNNLNPEKHYDVGVIKNPGDEKPEFVISWTAQMHDDTDDILNNSGNLPVAYPQIYKIKDNGSNSENVFDLVDNNGTTVGQVMNLTSTGDKPEFEYARTFKMVDNTKE